MKAFAVFLAVVALSAVAAVSVVSPVEAQTATCCKPIIQNPPPSGGIHPGTRK